MRPCLAATESATLMLFLTALAPGIVELAKMLSLSRWVSAGFLFGESSLLSQAARARVRRAPRSAIPRFDIEASIRWACWWKAVVVLVLALGATVRSAVS